MKIMSWNVNGLRAVLRKGALKNLLESENPDILCLQEIKAKPDQITKDFPELFSAEPFLGYEMLWNPAERAGYSGTGMLVKKNLKHAVASSNFPPEICQKYGLNKTDKYGNPCSEGRLQVVEFSDFTLVNVYVPNAKPDLSRLELRAKSWDPALRAYLQILPAPIIICGDFNAAHTAIDLARPKANEGRAGYTKEERLGIDNLIHDLKDTFRKFHPGEQRYTWWSHWGNARANNIGWRIDYFLVSPTLLPSRGSSDAPTKPSAKSLTITSADIHEQILGSDHCPISIILR